MARQRDDDSDDLRRVYRAHVQGVFAFFAYSVPREVAEDLTSSCFERVIRAWGSFDPSRASERTWIMTIARNVLTDHYRRESHRRAVSTDEHPGVIDRLVHDEHPLARSLSSEGFADWLRGLGPEARQVLALRFAADLSASEIAALCDLSVANVHQIVSRSLRRLREAAAVGRGQTDDVSGSV